METSLNPIKEAKYLWQQAKKTACSKKKEKKDEGTYQTTKKWIHAKTLQRKKIYKASCSETADWNWTWALLHRPYYSTKLRVIIRFYIFKHFNGEEGHKTAPKLPLSHNIWHQLSVLLLMVWNFIYVAIFKTRLQSALQNKNKRKMLV